MAANETAKVVSFRNCWMLFGGVNDLGFTHALNLGRLEGNRHLHQKYSQNNHNNSVKYTFDSIAVPNTFFMSEAEREALIEKFIKEEKCNFILGGSDILFNRKEVEYAAAYPNISFGRQTSFARSPLDGIPPNLIEYQHDWFNAAFVSGAVAATASETCAGFIVAMELRRSPWEHVMGFALGYRWVKPWQRVHVVNMNSYYRPDAEVLAASQLVEKMGCDIIVAHTDPSDVHEYVLSLRGRALSIARYIDMSTFVGDTVFTSQLLNFYEQFIDSMESSLISVARGTPGPMYEYSFGTDVGDHQLMTTPDGNPKQLFHEPFKTELSLFTSKVDQDLADLTKEAAEKYIQTNNPLCGSLWRLNGEAISGNDSSIYDVNGCPIANGIFPRSFLQLPNVTYYQDVGSAFIDGGAVCGSSNNSGGMYFTYDEKLDVTCHPCQENFYRPVGDRAEEVCLPCANGTYAAPGSSFCGPKIREDLSYIGSIRYFGLVLATLVIGTSIGFAVWVQIKSETPIVRASQPLFLRLLCLGTLIMGISIIPLMIDDMVASQAGCNIACMAFPWLFFTGFCTVFSALFSKIWRINQLFEAAKSFRRITVTTRDVVIPLIFTLSLNILFLLLWTFLDPATFSRVTVSEGISYGTCLSGWSTTSIILISMLLAVNVLAVLFANIEAYQSRSLSDIYSESKYIGLAMASILQVLLVGIPLIVLVRENPSAYFFVMTSVVFVTSMSLLLLIFVPKFFITKQGPDDSQGFLARQESGPGRRASQSYVSRHESGLGVVVLTERDKKMETIKKDIIDTNAKISRLSTKLRDRGSETNLTAHCFDELLEELDEEKNKMSRLSTMMDMDNFDENMIEKC